MSPTAAPPISDPLTARAPIRTALTRPGGAPVRILVVDDERVVAEMISMVLNCEGAESVTAKDASGAIEVARRLRPDVLILDPRLPDMLGSKLLRALRAERPDLVVLLLVPGEHRYAGDARIIAGDISLVKPFGLEELLLRIRRILRRSDVQLCDTRVELTVGDLTLSEDSRDVSRGGELIHLSNTEFELLRFFVRNAHRVVTKSQILGRVWPYDYAGRPTVVELYVSYLRKKIDAGRVPMIHTLRRTGYILKAA